MSLSYTTEPQPDVPVVDGALWRGVAVAPPPSLAVWGLIVMAIARWLT